MVVQGNETLLEKDFLGFVRVHEGSLELDSLLVDLIVFIVVLLLSHHFVVLLFEVEEHSLLPQMKCLPILVVLIPLECQSVQPPDPALSARVVVCIADAVETVLAVVVGDVVH